MPLNKAQLINRLTAILSKPETKNNAETAAREIADAFEEYVKGGTVTGVCPQGGGPLTGGKVT